jgi:hypothetical protein
MPTFRAYLLIEGDEVNESLAPTMVTDLRRRGHCQTTKQQKEQEVLNQQLVKRR